MAEIAPEASGGAVAAGNPDNAAGGMPTESDLPARQGLDADVPAGEGGLSALAEASQEDDQGDEQGDGDDSSGRGRADAEDREIGDLAASQIGRAPPSSSDPMTDPSGTSGT